MLEKVKNELTEKKNYLMYAYATGVCFMSQFAVAHASIGDQLQKPVNSAGIEVESMLAPGAVLIAIIVGVLLLFGKKKVAGIVLVGAMAGYFVVKNRNTLGNIFSGWF